MMGIPPKVVVQVKNELTQTIGGERPVADAGSIEIQGTSVNADPPPANSRHPPAKPPPGKIAGASTETDNQASFFEGSLLTTLETQSQWL